MRTNITNIQSVYQQQKQRKRRQWMIFFLGLLALGYGGVVTTVFLASRDSKNVSGQVAVSGFEGAVITRDAGTAAPVVATPKVTGSPRFSGNTSIIHTYASQGVTASAPQHSWQSTGAAVTVHTTSSAQVHNVGSGVSAGPAASSGNVSTAAFSHSTSSMVVPTLAWASARSLSVTNTRAAQASIIDAGTPEKLAKPGDIKRVSGTPEDFYEDEVPIGNGLWALLLLAAGYGVFVLRRRKQNA